MTSLWKPLHSAPSPHFRSLLIKYDFEQSQYKILLTDLTYIWTEALDRRQIVKRALNVDTSIDPSESTDQFHLLLRNIQKSLDGEEGTKLSMSRGGESKQLINLHVVTQLPAPLNPFYWPIHLILASPEVFTTELILPSLCQQFVAKAQIDSLLQQLKDKDHVISKMADRMQSDGTDFSKVFPGAIRSKVGTKLSVRESAGKLVKGLCDFDEVHWRKALSSLLGLSANLSDIIARIFVPGPGESLDVEISPDLGDWWHQLKEEDNQEEKVSTGFLSRKAASSNYTAMSQNDVSFNGDFQPQITPTRRSPPISRDKEKSAVRDTETLEQQQPQEPGSDHDSTTTSESDGEHDGDGQLQKPEVLSQDRYFRELGAQLTGSNLSPKVIPILHEADRFETDTPIPRSAIDGTYASPEIYPEKNKLSLNENTNSTESMPKPRGKLGRIGGKTKPEKRSELKDKPVSGRPTVLDDKIKATSVDTKGKEEDRVPADIGLTSPKASLTRRETSQERANNKREQLKRQLENKSNATVKKKRKF